MVSVKSDNFGIDWSFLTVCKFQLTTNFPEFLRQNHDPGDIYLQEGHIFVSLFDHV